MRLVPLTKGAYALVDDTDFECVSGHSWALSVRGTAVSRIDGRVITMHRFILGLHKTRSPLIDHRNRNPLDNQRGNLRAASNSQNSQNRGLQRTNRSGFKGVCWTPRWGWRATISLDLRQKHLGHFADLIEAACAYNLAAKRMFGEFAVMNRMD